MSRNRLKAKGRRESGSFVMLRHDIMASDNFKSLSAHATKALIDLLSQYKGGNNGDLIATWNFMKGRGWNSPTTMHAALRELLENGWIIKSRQGGNHKPTLYAVTWLPVDESNGKIDIQPASVPLNLWKHPEKINRTHSDYINTHSVTIPFPNKRKSA